MPDLLALAKYMQNSQNKSDAQKSDECDLFDEDLYPQAQKQNDKTQNKSLTKEEKRFNDFMEKIKQAKLGKSEDALLKERIVVAKSQCERVGKNSEGLIMFHYKAQPFTNQEECDAIRLIMLGETGCGKTTLMNTLLNVVLGVQFEDTFRFYLIREQTGKGQEQSQTSVISEYRINAHNGYPPIILIDTPGFGDTQGIERDDIIFQHLSKFLQKINYLHAVCMVAKSSVNRVSVYQNYIFDSVFNLFGKDVIENFICLLTFCDVGQPAILDSLQSEACDIREYIPNIQPPWYLKLNNIGMFCKNKFEPGEEQSRSFNQQYFELCKMGFERFFAKFCNLQPKTLALTKQQLDLKEQLEYNVEMMNRMVLECETHERNVEQLAESIKNNKTKINAHQGYMIPQDKINIDKKPVPYGQYTTTCLKCTRTCHENCAYSDDDDKDKCCAMNYNGYCTSCPGKCHYSQHRNLPYIIHITTTIEYKRSEDMFQKYQVASNEKNRAEALLQKACDEQMMASLQCLEYREKIADALRQLKTIALKKVDSTSTIEYIELQIKVLEEEKPANYHRRVKQLKDHKMKYENMQKLIKKEKGSMKDVFGAFHCFKNGRQIQNSNLWQKTKNLYNRFF
eukprot:TRINITY_DN26383_c1_g1_i3.p1 TRINITY_DN26383_c1_g1~~TRINITY_DN26383_c1_g1_i3.p1  ORF type:complete len:727 (-),score=79.85 TRINITY_DN26383_c1_g1_i3:410-2278(-)